jgi:hypothetical protein
VSAADATARAVEMERALLGCTTHLSGVLVTWHRCRAECTDAELAEVGAALLDRSRARARAARSSGSARGQQREYLLQPFVRALFGVGSP